MDDANRGPIRRFADFYDQRDLVEAVYGEFTENDLNRYLAAQATLARQIIQGEISKETYISLIRELDNSIQWQVRVFVVASDYLLSQSLLAIHYRRPKITAIMQGLVETRSTLEDFLKRHPGEADTYFSVLVTSDGTLTTSVGVYLPIEGMSAAEAIALNPFLINY